MNSSRWITNLEDTKALEAEVSNAERALKSTQAGTLAQRQAKAMLEVAKYKLADNKKTLREIERENDGRISLGLPQPTPYKTAEDIAKDGIIGIYRQGAGDGV